jgi:hypothetical protein
MDEHMPASAETTSRWVAADISPDTNPDSPFWRDAPATVADRDRYGKPLPSYRTTIRSRWTKQNLYLLFVCPYSQLYLKPDPRTDAETNQLWNWDVAEVFIGSDFEHPRRYHEFEVSPQSEWVDLDIDLDHPHPEGGWLWNSNFTVSARIDRGLHTWYGFMRIPYAAIDTRPAAAGNKLRVNFFRCEGNGPGRIYLTWQPSMSETFHVPEKFGVLTLI